MITITDVRAAGHCTRGAKAWFETYGLDFRNFLKHGINEEAFLATGDAHAIEIVRHKRAREAERG